MKALRFAAVTTMLVAASACGATTPTTPTGPAPVITKVSPATAAVGDQITITGTGFTATGNSVKLGSGYTSALSSSTTTSLSFTLPSALSVCAPSAQACVALAVLVTPGTYTVSVLNANGTSNEMSLLIAAK